MKSFKSNIEQTFMVITLILPILGCATKEQVAANRSETEKVNVNLKASYERDDTDIKIKVANSFVGLIQKIGSGHDNFVIQHKRTVYHDAQIGESSVYHLTEFDGTPVQGMLYCVKVHKTETQKSPFKSEEETYEGYVTAAVGFKVKSDTGNREYSSQTNRKSLKMCEPKNPKPFLELEKLLPILTR